MKRFVVAGYSAEPGAPARTSPMELPLVRSSDFGEAFRWWYFRLTAIQVYKKHTTHITDFKTELKHNTEMLLM